MGTQVDIRRLIIAQIEVAVRVQATLMSKGAVEQVVQVQAGIVAMTGQLVDLERANQETRLALLERRTEELFSWVEAR